MEHQKETNLSHRQAREHDKEGYKHSTPGLFLRSVHPTWYVIVAVIAVGVAVLIWTFVVW